MKLKIKNIPFSERIFSSLFFCAAILITIMLVPIIATFFRSGEALGLYEFYTQRLFLLSASFSAVFGFVLGQDKSFTILGHLWYTEEPHNKNYTISLWILLLSIGGITYVYS